MDKASMKELVDYALGDMPEESMDQKEREIIRTAMYKKIDAGEMNGPGDILQEFDRMEQEKDFYDSNQP